MEKTKHTPGPWSYRHWSNCSRSNLLEGYSISSNGHLVPMNTAEGDLYEAEANARLISAAPELLEALQLAADYIDVPTAWTQAQEDVLREKLNAAIAKATGA